ncbi:hypothetical protein SK3146_03166 [Paenibacillus konkukensis]|uniref:Glycosyltransferase 2-like domain-containing protein n=1 Tax=Paenibacillus konkukensis TaxID=2020716 RepID=A0ABY4RRE9_9BACL|nr:glycosyltransferase family 2 protein [Paenibacillus konkukensis]UQZ83954.1 hypothetical protein SK3146_03166 [Paenibacillus konkukensis]
MPSNLISVVIPCYNEEEVIAETFFRLNKVMNSISNEYRNELIFINDGSKDKTLEILRAIQSQNNNVKVVELSRNFGHQIAVSAGIDFSNGDAVILIDADLQDPPEMIIDFIDKWKRGFDVVYAVRKSRKGETWFKKATASLFYKTLKKVVDIDIPLNTGDFRLMDKKVVHVLKQLKEKHRFIRGLVSWVGFKQIGIEYDRAERFAGETKYPLKKMIKFSIDAITSFSFVPLKIAGFLGLSSAAIGFFGIAYSIVLKLLNVTIPGWSSLMIVILFLGGMQLFILGIIGEYIGRIYDETRNRPLYVLNNQQEDEFSATYEYEKVTLK